MNFLCKQTLWCAKETKQSFMLQDSNQYLELHKILSYNGSWKSCSFFWEDNKQKILSPIYTPLQRNLSRKTEALGPTPHTHSIQKRTLNYKEGTTKYFFGYISHNSPANGDTTYPTLLINKKFEEPLKRKAKPKRRKWLQNIF